MVAEKKIYERAIINWPEEDRPREKLLKYGAHTLSNGNYTGPSAVASGIKGLPLRAS